MIFETHAHYDDRAFDEDRDQLLLSLADGGIEAVVNVGASIQTTKNTLDLMDKYPFVYGAVGVHPNETAELTEDLMNWLEHISRRPKVVAIGEIGLDYYWDKESHEQQKEWFIRQMNLAREKNLPVNIHSREAAADTFDIMKEYGQGMKAIIHCYSYSKEMALEYVKMGYLIGVGGVVTFKNAKKLKEVVQSVPIEHIVLETDCPYLAPDPYRGKRNSSLYLPYVARAIADLKEMTEEEVIKITTENARRFYGI